MRPLDSRRSTRARRLGGTVVVALGVLALASTLLATAAGAAGLGTVKISGQVAGKITLSSTTTGPEGIPLHGCQVGQESTQLLINLPSSKVTLNGKSVKIKASDIVIGVTKNGNTEQITPSGSAGVELQIQVGKTNYNWAATSGSVSTKAKGNGGSFNVTMPPAGQAGGDPVAAGKATGTAKMSGSFSSCHAFDN